MHPAEMAEKADDGGGVGAVVDHSGGAASLGTVTLQLTVWEQWM